jgi:hypothetical protein
MSFALVEELLMFHIVELNKEGIFSLEKFKTKEEAEDRKSELISIWTHWDLPEMPCYKKFEVIKGSDK